MPKEEGYKELVKYHELKDLLEAMVDYKLNHALPGYYKFANPEGMAEVIENIFLSSKNLQTGFKTWEDHKEKFFGSIFPSKNNRVNNKYDKSTNGFSIKVDLQAIQDKDLNVTAIYAPSLYNCIYKAYRSYRP